MERISPVRPNTESTGTTLIGLVHTGAPPLMVRTWPSLPVMNPTVFPIRESPLLKVKRSVNCPVVLLYPTPFEPERERREILVETTHERERISPVAVVR